MENKAQREVNVKECISISRLQVGIQICEYHDDLRLLYANEAFYHLIGYSQAEYEEVTSFKHPLCLSNEMSHIKKFDILKQLSLHGEYHLEYSIVHKNQETIWILEKGELVHDQAGNVYVQSVLIDLSEQKQLEEALAISEKRYEVAIDRSDVTLFDFDVNKKQMIFCDYDMKTFGFPRMLDNCIEHLINQKVIHPSSATNFSNLYQKICDGAKFAKDNISIYVDNGEVRVFEISLSTIFDKKGKPVRAIGVKKDITDFMMLQREKEYNDILKLEHAMVYEVNMSRDILIDSNLFSFRAAQYKKGAAFSEIIKIYCDEMIYLPHREKVLEAISKENVMSHLNKGEHRFSIKYLRLNEENQYRWVENTVHIILDLVSDDVIIRGYLTDIHEQKSEEYKNGAQFKHYQALLSKSSAYYEINITKDEFQTGYEKWYELAGVELSNYEMMLTEFAHSAVHLDDRVGYLKVFSRENLLDSFYRGESKIVHEYRQLDQQSKYSWVRYTMHLYEDVLGGDVNADGYVEMIHEEKEKELNLIYKSQHDSLTGFFNKATLEERINEYLQLPEAKGNMHSFMIIDLDYFKLINDNFGHAFGDAVLSRVSAKIASLFRDVDILGRIGGDEFVVFMKNVRHDNGDLNKAKEIIDLLYESFTQNGIEINVSSSIGIAHYHEHGLTYQELYEHSDAALYLSKEHGRNRYTVYSSEMRNSLSEIKAIDQNALLEMKKFDDHIIEYIFRILYESKDKSSAIHAVLALVGKHYNVSRTYVFENSEDDESTCNTFEWCNKGIEPQIDNLKQVSYQELDNYVANFNEDGIFYMPDIDLQKESIKQILEPQEVRSMLQFTILRNGKFKGFIGFDQCGFVRVPSTKEISDVRNIANILGVFIMEMRAMEETEQRKDIALSIVNGLDSYAYVCDPETYRVLYINDQTLKIQPTAAVGQHCYKAFWNRESPCESCPMTRLKNEGSVRVTYDMENTNLHIWVRATASWIDWMNSKKVCLVDSVDITQYKQGIEE